MTEAEWAYLAGFVDGEGCIYCSGVSGKHYPRITISQRIPTPLIWLQQKVGGSLKEYQAPRGGPVFRWKAGNNPLVVAILKGVLPYLQLKGPQAEIALELATDPPISRHLEIHEELKRLKHVAWEEMLPSSDRSPTTRRRDAG